MNEALDILFQDAVSTGYKGTKDDFSNLLKTNPEARKIVFDDAVSTGYNGTFDDFNSLIGLTAQPVAVQPDKKKVATALPSAPSSSESVSTRPTEPTIATRKPQTTSFGTYGVSKPQPPTAPFKKPVAPEPESILGPVDKDMSVSREVSMRPTQPAMPKPSAPEPTSEANDYFTKSLDIVKSDLIGLAEGEVIPKLRYTFGQYDFQFNEAGPMFDEVEVIAPDGKTKEIFSLDNFTSDTDSAEAARLRKFISENRPKSELLAAKEGQYTKPILEDKQIQETIMSLNADTDKLNKDFQEFKRLSSELEAKVSSVESMTPQQKEQFIQASNILEAKRLDIIRREQQIKSRDKSLEAEVGKYASMKGESGNAFTAVRDALYGIIDNTYYGTMRSVSAFQDAIGLGSPVNTATSILLQVDPEAKEFLRSRYASESYKEYRESLPWLANAALGLVESTPAMIPAVGLPISIMQYTGQNYEELDNSDLSEGKKTSFAMALAVPSAILSKMGFENAVSEKLLGELLLKRALPRIGINFTLPQVTKVIENDVKNLMAKGILRIGVAGAAEFESGALEEVIDIGGKELINSLEEKEIFKTPENFLEGVKQVAEAGAAEAVGGAIIGTVSAVSKGYRENKFDKMLDEQVELSSKISSDPTFINAYKVKIKQDVAEGKITAEEGQLQEQSFDKMVGQLRSIPDGISPAGQKEALRLIKERDDLQTKIDASDPDLVAKEKARVAEIKEKLGKISEQYPQKEEAAVETPAGNRTFDNIKNEDIKFQLNGFKKEHESSIDFYEGELMDEDAKAEKKSLELLNKNPEKYLEEKISYLEKFFKDENESDAKRIENESDADRKKGLEEYLQKNKEYRASRIDYLKNLLTRVKEDYAVQESSTAEGVLRNEEPQVGLQEMGEGNAEGQAAPQETIVQEEVTAEPLDQKSNRLLDAIDTARQAGADGIDALNSSLANLRGIASERVKQIGNRIDDLQQKVRDLTKSSTVPSATISDLAGTQVNYNGESGTLNISEGGAVTFETPNQVIEIENATPTSMAADFKIEAPKPAIEITPTTDRFIDNDNVVINNVEYGIQADDNGNVVGLQLKDGSNQVLTNPQLLVKAEAIRNTEGKVAITTETTIAPEAQSQIDALNSQIDALTNERSRIEQATAEPVAAEATPTEKRFAGNVLAATRVVAEDLAKLVAILTKANRNVKVITDKQAMIDFLVSNGITPEQAAQVKGFRFGDKVYINPDLATVDTPIHEFAHIWGELCKKQRPELWKRGISLITKSNYYKDLLARIKANPELSKLYATPEAIKEEALIQAIGERGAVIFDDNKLQLLWNNWVAAFDNFVKKLLGLPMTTDITKIKLSEFLDMAATEVLTGKATGIGGEMTIEKTKAAKNIEAQVEAWHGSPYEFAKFLLSNIGTGEGVQAFGWGLYFTDLKDIAKVYAKSLAKTTFAGKSVDDNPIFEKLFSRLDAENEDFYNLDKGTIYNLGKFKEYIDDMYDYLSKEINKIDENHRMVKRFLSDSEYSQEKIESARDSLRNKEDVKKIYDSLISNGVDKEISKQLIDRFERVRKSNVQFLYDALKYQSSRDSLLKKAINFVKNDIKSDLNYFKYLSENFDKFNLSRNLYKVNLFEGKTPDQYTFLEWDKPLNKQRANELISKLTENQREQAFGYGLSGINTEGDFYKKLANALGDNLRVGSKNASLFLLENGIDGVKYPAESISRGATSDTARGFNYVVFDENAVKIQEAIQFQAQQSANDLAKIIKDAIKAKLTKAQIVDILVKRGGLTAAEANQAYNDVKAGNAIAATPSPTAPTTATPEPKGTKFATRIADAIEKMSNGVFDNSVKQALIDNINAARTQIRQALTTEKALRKELIDILKQMRTSGKLSQTQALSLLRSFANTDIYSDASVNRFVNTVMSAMQNAEAKQEDSRLASAAKVASKNIMRKIGMSESLTPLLKAVFSIKPSAIPASVKAKYTALVDMMSQRGREIPLGEIGQVTDMANDVFDAIQDQFRVMSLKRVFRNFENKVFDSNNELDLDATINAMIDGNIISAEDADIIRNNADEFKAELKDETVDPQERIDLIDGIKSQARATNVDNLQNRMERDAARELIKMINEGGIEALTNNELANLSIILSNINNGIYTHYANTLSNAMSYYLSANGVKSLVFNTKPLAFSAAYANIVKLFTKSKSKIETMITQNPIEYLDQLLGNFGDPKVFKKLFNNVAKLYATYKSKYLGIDSRLNKAYDKVFKSHRFNIELMTESNMKMYAYLLQLEYMSNIGVKGVNPAAKYIDATIKQLRKDMKNAEADILEKIKDEFVINDQVDIDKLYNSFNAAEKSAINEIREINNGNSDMALYTSAVITGDKSKTYANYIHHNVIDDSDNSREGGLANMMMNNTNPSTKAKSLISRTGGVRALNFDPFAATRKSSKQILIDYYLTDQVRRSRGTINALRNMAIEEGKFKGNTQEAIQALEEVLNKALENTFLNAYLETTLADDVSTFIQKTGYRAILGRIPRVIGEFLSNVSAIIMDPVAFVEGLKYSKILMSDKGPEIMKNLNANQQTRIYPSGGLSGSFVDTDAMMSRTGKRGISNKFLNKLSQLWNYTGKPLQNATETIADNMISGPDKIVARPMWFGKFATEFKKITGVDPDFDKIAANDEAYMTQYKEALENATDQADVTSTRLSAANNPFKGILKNAINPKQGMTKKLFIQFNSFMTQFLIYDFNAARTAVYALAGKGTISKTQATMLLSGIVLRMMTYQIIMNQMNSLIGNLFKDEDDEEENEKSFTDQLTQAAAGTLASFAFGRNFGNTTRTLVNYGVEKVNEKYFDFLREGEYDPYTDKLVYSPIQDGKINGLDDVAIALSGPLSPTLKTAKLAFRAFGKEKKEEDAIKRQELEKARVFLETGGNAGLVPFYGDIRAVFNSYIYKDLKDKIKGMGASEGVSREFLKRYFPAQYESLYGEQGSITQAEAPMKAAQKEIDSLIQKITDEAMGYVEPSEEEKKEKERQKRAENKAKKASGQ